MSLFSLALYFFRLAGVWDNTVELLPKGSRGKVYLVQAEEYIYSFKLVLMADYLKVNSLLGAKWTLAVNAVTMLTSTWTCWWDLSLCARMDDYCASKSTKWIVFHKKKASQGDFFFIVCEFYPLMIKPHFVMKIRLIILWIHRVLSKDTSNGLNHKRQSHVNIGTQ